MKHGVLRALALAGVLLVGPAAQAGHHRWDFTEIFSNADGSVQYIEMFSANSGEAGLGPFTITAGANTFDFVTNLSGDTANTWVLIATSGFGALPGGVTPDYILPASFFSTAGGTLNYAGGADVWAYGAVPTGGVLALQRDGSTATNSPTNFAGATGSVDLSTPTVPSVAAWGITLAVGAILLAASGLLRRESYDPG
ncbi:MAG: hypothetical protein ACQGVC_06820 [Myxococcota bacterium]